VSESTRKLPTPVECPSEKSLSAACLETRGPEAGLNAESLVKHTNSTGMAHNREKEQPEKPLAGGN